MSAHLFLVVNEMGAHCKVGAFLFLMVNEMRLVNETWLMKWMSIANLFDLVNKWTFSLIKNEG